MRAIALLSIYALFIHGSAPDGPLPRHWYRNATRALQQNSAPSWLSPGANYVLPVPDLTPVGAVVLSIVAADPDPSYSIFGQLVYTLISVTPTAPFLAVTSGGRLTLTGSAGLAWGGAPRTAGGVPFSLVLRATDCGGASFGLSAPDLNLTVLVMPSYMPPPCPAFARLGWQYQETWQGALPDYGGWPVEGATSPALRDAYNTPVVSAGGSCYFRLEKWVGADFNFINNLCGAQMDNAGLATIRSAAEADFVVGQQCGVGPRGAPTTPPLPNSAVGIAVGLHAGHMAALYGSTNYNLRNAAGSLPQVWGWYKNSLDTAWVRSPAGAPYWAAGHPLGGTNPWVYVSTRTTPALRALHAP